MPRTTAPTRPRLDDVAERSGVAKSTVSRVLNNYTKNFTIRDEVRQRVLDAAKELGFEPNPFVRSLRAKKTNLIALIGLRDFGWSSRGTDEAAINRMLERFSEHAYDVSSTFLGPNRDQYAPPRWRVDGIIVVSSDYHSQLDKLDRSGTPYVCVNGPAARHGASVVANDPQGTQLAINHLRQLGHERIAFLKTRYSEQHPIEPDHHVSSRTRLNAYIEAMNANGLQPMDCANDYSLTAEQGVRAAIEDYGATAILSYHHVMAIQHMSAIQRMGLSIPDDVSLICFNDAFPCEEVNPPLTCISVPGETMGEAAATLLLRWMDKGSIDANDRIIHVDESLIVRESTAPPKGA
ncbi:LacI family DNA-binding transcriptional regulator [Mucisphaera calidilacus]|uniref:HTH-type transcriptional regulator DegA n=1 Tax=Mucisphaera calidilacus TaxID=2527982 RepID=A0A518BX20_9BACT|nr:LacI family DNA-binding transcriptional regulator [Mucisphaera calidilacus]QDU71516.1 HTH-type transcriptional regulator DegA [Mucisphaera calidilacus]